jgi:hypothetical protein
MLMISWRRKQGLVLGVLTILVSLSELAEAQVSGLFPLHPIRRQRVPCPEEDPVYRLNRTQYFGYHPTVWRRFPDGWGFRSPEAADREKEFKELPVKPPEPAPPEEGDERDMEAPPDRGRPAIPNPPAENERSPFELDRPNQAAPGAGAPPRRPAAPRATQPTRPNEPAIPDLAPPGDAGDAPPPPRTSRNEDQSDRAALTERGPLLAMPDAGLPAVEEATPVGDPGSRVMTETADGAILGGDAATAPVAAPTPSRRGRLSSLFGGLGLNWLRR